MTDKEFDEMLRAALMEATMADFAPVFEGDPPPPQLSAGYLRWEKRLLADPFGFAKKQARPLWKKALRAAACVLLCAGVALGAAMLNPAARAWVVAVVEAWFPQYTSFTFTAPAREEANPGVWRPDYVPEGFSESDYSDLAGSVSLVYENIGGEKIYFDYMPATQGGKFSVDNEHSDYSELTIQNHAASLFASNTEEYFSFLIWTDEEAGVAFQITSKLDYRELISMGESVKKEE